MCYCVSCCTACTQNFIEKKTTLGSHEKRRLVTFKLKSIEVLAQGAADRKQTENHARVRSCTTSFVYSLLLLTLSAHAPRGYCSCLVCLSVCSRSSYFIDRLYLQIFLGFTWIQMCGYLKKPSIPELWHVKSDAN